jgi:hypothetical protein
MPLGLGSSNRSISLQGLHLCKVIRQLDKVRFRLDRRSNSRISTGMFRLVSTSLMLTVWGHRRCFSSNLSSLCNLHSHLPWFLLTAQLWELQGGKG